MIAPKLYFPLGEVKF